MLQLTKPLIMEAAIMSVVVVMALDLNSLLNDMDLYMKACLNRKPYITNDITKTHIMQDAFNMMLHT
jgi:hypothetical protein